MAPAANTLENVLVYAIWPVLAAVLGAVVSAWRQPGPALRSSLQHFAAGVVFSVVGVELLPDILREHKPIPVIVGFTMGIAALLALRWFGPSEGSLKNNPGKLPLPFLFAMGVDILIDGFLIGIGFAAGPREGKLLALALTVELLSLGIATVVTLTDAAIPRKRAIVVTSFGASLILVGAGLGGTVLRGLSHTGMELVLSFGLAALLFLVVEELLVEAHEVPETPLITSTFFVGFLLFLVLGIVL
ncbi:MAG: transporter [Acidobacteria bacterium]|jgi:zinc transporter, ZIP family|nr:transporter [Acidobacteriota bacterium]